MRRKILFLFLLGIFFIALGLIPQYKSTNSKKDIENKGSNVQEVQKEFKEESSTPSSSLKSEKEVLISKVLDGDTLETSSKEKIRLIGVNAPEKGQPFANEAKAFIEGLILNKNVQLKFDVQAIDRYGRTLAYVFSGSNLINLELVKNGLGVSETIQPNVKYQDEFIKAQKKARENCVGIWTKYCEVQGSSTENCIKIVLINANAVGDDNKNKNGEWIEIKNTCSNDVSMSGWLLKDSSASNHYLFKDFILLANKNVFLYSGCGENSSEKLFWKCPEQKYAVWNNSQDEAFLYNEKGELVSNYNY